jgi:hypothetical protein
MVTKPQLRLEDLRVILELAEDNIIEEDRCPAELLDMRQEQQATADRVRAYLEHMENS